MHFLNAFAVLDPKGTISLAERALMIHAVEFMLIVAIPVYILLFFFAWRYRDRGAEERANTTHSGVAYMPDWEHGKMEELIWWAIPFEIILILGALTWGSTHALAPTKPLSDAPPLVIDVVALDWKWLFIYPAQGIATVDYIRIPVNQPVEFMVTADAPMNSFWIPQLGGQIYAMTGMVNPINLEASETGVYQGGSANYSGAGFAQMQFKAEATSQADFESWVANVKSTASAPLTLSTYNVLAQPTATNTIEYYGAVEPTLYNTIVTKFMDLKSIRMQMNDDD